MNDTALVLRLTPSRAARGLAIVISTLTLLSLGSHVWRFAFGQGRSRWYLLLFDLNWEHSVPTYWQGILLLGAAILLAAVGISARNEVRPHRAWWLVMAAMFVWLSFDELAEMHEMLGFSVQKLFKPQGYFYYAWVIPGIIGTVVTALICLRPLMQLPLRTSLWFIAAGLLYVGGALGVEMVSANHAYLYGEQNFIYCVLADAEESLEMTGVAVFTTALLDYAARLKVQIVFRF